ncbi:MAG: LysR family transcriptional regulator [Candidatus Micrarchaeaceae archaeon]
MVKDQRYESGWLNISIGDLNTVCLIYETMNFDKVAKIMGINKSLVSYRLQKMEKNLGFKIFKRDGKRIEKPTELGYKFIRSAQDILAIILRNFPDTVAINDTIISTGEVPALTFLPRLIQRYENKFNKSIKLEVSNNLSVLNNVINGKASIGIVSSTNFKEIKDYLPLISQKKIFTDEIVLILPKEWENDIKTPISINDLLTLFKTKPFIGRTHGSGIQALMEQWLRKNNIPFPKQEFSFSNSSSVISAVSRGMGFSMVFKTQVLPLLGANMFLACSMDPPLIGGFNLIMLKHSVNQEAFRIAKFIETEILKDA